MITGGYGSGSGDGSGSGYGDGYGYGYGYGYGSGSGYGDGYGSGPYLSSLLLAIPSAKSAKKAGGTLAFWFSREDGAPAHGGGGGPRAVGQIEEIPGPLRICTKNALHAVTNPFGSRWAKERLGVVALYGEIQKQDDKIAALKREILGECTWWSI